MWTDLILLLQPLPGEAFRLRQCQKTPAVQDSRSEDAVEALKKWILLWNHISNFTSHVLTHRDRRWPKNWLKRYAICPMPLETFREILRFIGTCYKATNWIRVGQTQKRGKLDMHSEYALPIMDIWLKTLDWELKSDLNS